MPPPRRAQFVIGMTIVIVLLLYGGQMSRLLTDIEHIEEQPEPCPDITELTAKPAPGWADISLYVGSGVFEWQGNKLQKGKPIEPLQSHSQAGQDVMAASLNGCKRDGFFVDLAAHHAIEISNTVLLEALGWTGICIEAMQEYWWGLAHRTCKVFGGVIGSEEDEAVRFNDMKNGLSGLVGPEYDNKVEQGHPITRHSTRLDLLLKSAQAPEIIDYLSLDVEGAEMDIMSTFPFEEYTIRVTTTERPGVDLKELFQEHGYIEVREIADFGEVLWVHPSLEGVEGLLTKFREAELGDLFKRELFNECFNVGE
ncbi:unnamed protein product [Chrysoparadoxa australica]